MTIGLKGSHQPNPDVKRLRDEVDVALRKLRSEFSSQITTITDTSATNSVLATSFKVSTSSSSAVDAVQLAVPAATGQMLKLDVFAQGQVLGGGAAVAKRVITSFARNGSTTNRLVPDILNVGQTTVAPAPVPGAGWDVLITLVGPRIIVQVKGWAASLKWEGTVSYQYGGAP